VQKYIEEINNIKPDILFYGGDIVEGAGYDIANFEAMLRNIKCRFGVYGIPGNHDRIVNFRDNFFTRSGIVLLRDSVVTVDNSFVVAGRKISRNSRKDAGELINGTSDLPVIMLDHIPTDFNNISSTTTDLVFSGHTHAGQLFPINLYLKSVYELSHGYMKKGNTHFIVSSGIRLWGPRVRTTGKSEIVVAEIEFI
jgi:predicted MPP superfamily phosphohydrolase